MNENFSKALADSLTPYDFHKYANAKPIEVETIPLKPVPKFADDEDAIKAHMNDDPLMQLHTGYARLGYILPLMKFEENRAENTWTCKLYEGETIHEGKSRDRQTAVHIAATYMLDSMVEKGKSNKFFLPQDKEDAHRHIAAKREKLIKLAEAKNMPNPYKCIAEYAQFNRITFSAQETGTASPFSSTVSFDGKLYTAEGVSKKEARKNAAGIVFAELVESNKYSEYKQAHEKAMEERKLKTAKYRLPKVALSTGETSNGNGVTEKTLPNELMNISL